MARTTSTSSTAEGSALGAELLSFRSILEEEPDDCVGDDESIENRGAIRRSSASDSRPANLPSSSLPAPWINGPWQLARASLALGFVRRAVTAFRKI
jgi:hypothetical protein